MIPFVSASVTGNKLLNASLHNSVEETDIRTEISKTDMGILVALGTDHLLSQKHNLQFSVFYSRGFLNIFNGIYRANGLKAYHSVIGLRIAYNLTISDKKINKTK